MRKLTVYLLAPTMLVGVIVFLIVYIINLNDIDEQLLSANTNEQIQVQQNIPTQKNDGWLKHFANSETKGYFYPVSEVFVEYKLKKLSQDLTEYFLELDKVTPYQFFCLKEVLHQFDTKHIIKKYNDKVRVVLYSKNKKYLQKITNELKIYEIDATISKVKRES